jgi:hypothetical protein
MTWLFAQMWALEVAAFLLGAAVTWAVFVRPARSAARAARPVPLPPAWASNLKRSEPVPEPSPPTTKTPADSALADLDAHTSYAHHHTGLFATGVLDQIESTSPLPVVPAQGRLPLPRDGSGRRSSAT